MAVGVKEQENFWQESPRLPEPDLFVRALVGLLNGTCIDWKVPLKTVEVGRPEVQGCWDPFNSSFCFRNGENSGGKASCRGA